MNDCANQFFKTPTRLLSIRVSHPIKGFGHRGIEKVMRAFKKKDIVEGFLSDI